MKLDARLYDCAVSSSSATCVALRLWTLRTPGPEPTKLMIPPGARALELYATLEVMERGATVLENDMRAGSIVDRFADAFVECLDMLDAGFPGQLMDLRGRTEAESHLTICYAVCQLLSTRSRCSPEAQLHRSLVEDTDIDDTLHGSHERAWILFTVLKIAATCNGNTIDAVLDYVKSGLFLAALQLLPNVTESDSAAFISGTHILFTMKQYCYRLRAGKAVRAVLEAQSDLVYQLGAER
ncbi:hypothetical protein BKA70DRAFT_528819 [Coprinopsis sp. MPI-PUGE-AT-0042]|nr:hypothetical protein BKA70DRAFT_528819 [Coprinopsis sp. MPI-PUGE-AT-0042]